MSLAFSEPVQIHEKCKGSFIVKSDDAALGKVKIIPCSSEYVVAFGNKVSVAWTKCVFSGDGVEECDWLPAGKYSLIVETDSLSDLSGNRNTFIDTKAEGFEFEVDTSETTP